ncbi:MAG: FAD:protein FMN transferase [Bacteroidales bacterium]|nr:FAD:protein FMN transferase [Bacteroidales bacterium]
MNSRLYIFTIVILTLCSCSRQNNYITVTGFAQGSEYMVKLNLDGVDKGYARRPSLIKAGIDSVLTAIDNSLSGYNKGSLLSRFNAGETVTPDEIFIDMYNISRDYYDLSGGAFDVAAGPLFDIWGFGFKGEELPSDEEVAAILEGCGMDRLRADMREAIAEDGTILPKDLLLPQYAAGQLPVLNYNAIAQGYSCDLVADWLYGIGVDDMLIMIGGGEIYCNGENPSGKPWIIGVDKPVDGNDEPGAMLEGTISADGRTCGIVTSGNYRKFYIKDGRKYAHTIDPRTGYPASHSLLSATIIADDATTADALATYCMVIGLEASQDFITSRDDLEGYLIYDAGTDTFGEWRSPGLHQKDDQ